jgi:hypothetical protein
MHSVPVPDVLWNRAVSKAKTEGTSVAAVVREALAKFAPEAKDEAVTESPEDQACPPAHRARPPATPGS